MFDRHNHGVLSLKELERILHSLGVTISSCRLITYIQNTEPITKNDGWTWTDLESLLSNKIFHTFLDGVNVYTFRYNISCIRSCITLLSKCSHSYADISNLRLGFEANALDTGLPSTLEVILHSLRLANRIISPLQIENFLTEREDKKKSEPLTLFDFLDLSGHSIPLNEAERRFENKTIRDQPINNDMIVSDDVARSKIEKILDFLDSEYKRFLAEQSKLNQPQSTSVPEPDIYDHQQETAGRRLFSSLRLHSEISQVKSKQSKLLKTARAGILPKSINQVLDRVNQSQQDHTSPPSSLIPPSPCSSTSSFSKVVPSQPPVPQEFSFKPIESFETKQQWMEHLDRTHTARERARKERLKMDGRIKKALVREHLAEVKKEKDEEKIKSRTFKPCVLAARRVQSRSQSFSQSVNQNDWNVPRLDLSCLRGTFDHEILTPGLKNSVETLRNRTTVKEIQSAREEQSFLTDFSQTQRKFVDSLGLTSRRPHTSSGQSLMTSSQNSKNPPQSAPPFKRRMKSKSSRPKFGEKFGLSEFEQTNFLPSVYGKSLNIRKSNEINSFKKENSLESGISQLLPSKLSARLTHCID
ncbi:hypothetical protein P9112_000372 [Eukaryota sp. TZLM1-RC]